VLPGKEKVVNELRKLAAGSDAIYLATDLDREGEAIAWHLREAIGGEDSRYQRVVFNEITKKAITEAFDHPAHLDQDRVNAQQARRFLDRVVGYMVSPLLWSKVARGLSAGRVQSVAVRLIVEREREIRAFIPDESWKLMARFALDPDQVGKLVPAWDTFAASLDEKGNTPTQRAQNAWLAEHRAMNDLIDHVYDDPRHLDPWIGQIRRQVIELTGVTNLLAVKDFVGTQSLILPEARPQCWLSTRGIDGVGKLTRFQAGEQGLPRDRRQRRYPGEAGPLVEN